MSNVRKTIDDIIRTKTTVADGDRIPGRDDTGDFKITFSNFVAPFQAIVGQIIPWTGDTAPSAFYLMADGSAVSRITYADAAAVWIKEKGAVTFSSSSGLLATYVAHGLTTGSCISFSTTGSLPTGISLDTSYYVVYVSADTFRISTSLDNALAGTVIAYTDAGSDCVLWSNPWGIKDADEMYLPDFEGFVPVGAGAATIRGRTKDNIAIGAAVEDQGQKLTGQITASDSVSAGGTSTATGAFTFVAAGQSAGTPVAGRGVKELYFNSSNSPDARTSSATAGPTRETKKAINYIVRVL